MKPIAISSYLAFAALSLYAADPQAASEKSSAPQPTLHSQTLSAPPQGTTGDSPLVRAAKATNRFGKKPSLVITNDTLIHSGGHFTTTTPEAQLALPSYQPPAGSSPEQQAADAKKKQTEALTKAERLRKAEEARKTAMAQRAAREEGDTPEAIYGDPPPLEGPIQTLKPQTPQTMGQPQKPPE